MTDWDKYQHDCQQELAAATDSASLREISSRYVGRRSLLTAALREEGERRRQEQELLASISRVEREIELRLQTLLGR